MEVTDPRVAHAIAHFGPRYTVNGVTFSDFKDVTSSITQWADWCRAWSARGLVHETMGRTALEAKQFASAGEHLKRAAACYHFGKYLFSQDPDQMRTAHLSAVECYSLALPHLDPPGERVLIPYEGKHLAGVLRRPRNIAKPPLVLMCNGLDSAKEELDSFQETFLRRGMAILAVDGPGQGEAEYDFAIRGDYEAVIKILIDWLESRSDIDTSRLGLWGLSLGGYYAPRAAAFEKRISACVGICGPYDWGALWDDLPPLTQEAFRLRSKSADATEAKRNAAALSLRGVAEKIECPLFIVGAGLDRLCPPEDARRLVSEAKGPTELLIVEDGNHVAHNRPYSYRPQTADWMAKQLGVSLS
jgi:pimeloyl-ACP methyl ester carboxylesterase